MLVTIPPVHLRVTLPNCHGMDFGFRGLSHPSGGTHAFAALHEERQQAWLVCGGGEVDERHRRFRNATIGSRTKQLFDYSPMSVLNSGT
jgi:hypothetical protein